METLSKAEKRALISEHAASLDIEDLMDALDCGGVDTADGCWVEADGVCPHGFPSPLLAMGMI